jgi:hypothetical protein
VYRRLSTRLTGHDPIDVDADDGTLPENERGASKRTNSHKSAEDVKLITDKWLESVERGRMTLEGLAAWWNKGHPENLISKGAVGKYTIFYKKNKEYFVPHKGRPTLLTPEQSDTLKEVVIRLRQRGNAVCACLLRHAARGILRRDKAGAMKLRTETIKCSLSWGREWLISQGYAVRKATTDRTCQAGEINDAGKPFYDALKELVEALGAIDPSLVYNMDEFMILMNTAFKWTWHRRFGGSKIVPIRQMKQGTTCSVLSNMKELKLLQLIWKGTERVHAEGPGSKKILQQHRDDSHFQNADTFKVWLGKFIKIVEEDRKKLGKPDAPAVLILDAAPQHGDPTEELKKHNIHFVEVPKKMTHVFQPADQYIICNLKKVAKKVKRREEGGSRSGVSCQEGAQ